MKIRMAIVPVLAAAAMLSGCVEEKTVLKLKKDGSGTVMQEVYMSPQITSMMESMSAAMPAGDDKAKKPAVDPLAMFADDIEKRVTSMGEGVKLVKKEARTNAKGWKGFLATFSFPDINKLSLSLMKKDDQGGGDGKEPPMTVAFKKQPRATITFQQKAAAKPAADPAVPAGQPAPDAAMAAMGGAMMAPMLQGMRMTFVVEVDGKIVKTNSHYKQGDNAILLMDLPMDKVLANAQGMQMISGNKNDPDMLKKLRDLKIEGLAIEDMEQGVTIEFE